MRIEIDGRELLALGDDLKRTAKHVDAEIKPIIKKGAVNIRKQLRKEMLGSKHFHKVAPTIGFDLFATSEGIWADIGPAAEGAGNLANIAYFGGSGWTSRRNPGKGWQQGPGGGGNVRDPKHALETEAPNVERYLTKLVEGLL